MLPRGVILVATLAAAPLAAGSRDSGGDAGEDAVVVYVGTYTDGDSRGIYSFTLDLRSGETTPPRLAAEAENPSFLAAGPGGRLLYAVNETDDFGGEATGAVTAFAVDGESRDLRVLNQQPSMGTHPCHIVLDREGRHALVANYGGGNVAVFPLREDGRLAPASAVLAHEGSGPNARRQERPHAHGVALSPDERVALVADLGADRIFLHRFDGATGALVPGEPPSTPVSPGSGPRHVVFHPGGRFVYSINELLSTVTAFAFDPRAGTLEALQTLSTLPEGFAGRSSTAEIVASPDGRFVYGSNRGHDSIALFVVDPDTGRLTPAGHTPTGGRTPRSFTLDPSGRWLLAANQGSDTIGVFRVDPGTGRPHAVGEPLTVPKPVCLLVAPPPR